MTPISRARVPSGGQHSAARRALAGATVAAVLGGLLLPTAIAGTASAASAAGGSLSAAATIALPVVTQDVSPLSAFDAELIRLINVARAGAGVAPVQEARGLDGMAGWWSDQLAAGSGTLAHNTTGLAMVTGYGASKRTLWAENVAKLSPASAVTAQSLFDTYLASASHRANILNPAFGYIGVGSVSTAAGISFNTVNFTDVVDAGQTFDPRAAVSPIGQFQSAALAGATLRLTGWGLDPELTTAASTVRITDTAADGTVATRTATAAVSRPELGTAYPASGAAHGFDVSYVTGGRGNHTVCATVVDTGAGLGDTALGCLPYTVGDPVGTLGVAAVTGRTLTVGGWAVDPDQPTSGATVTITDRFGATSTTSTVVANATDAAAEATVPGAGTAHGFTTVAAISGPGDHSICASVAGIAATTVVTDLGCRTVTVDPAAPVGTFDTVGTPDRRSVSLAGWAADPDFPLAPSTVTVAVTNSAGTTTTTLTAGADYATDLGSGLGRTHAFTGTLPLTAEGVNTVCVRSVSRSSATLGTDLGCRSVSVTWLHGWLDKVTPTTSGTTRTLAVAGWAIDESVPLTATPVALKVTGPNGYAATTTVQADALRADVGRAFAGTGNNHGFVTTLKVPAKGSYQVCATEISPRDPSLSRQLRCMAVTVS